MVATSFATSEVPNLTCLGLSRANRECISNDSMILVSPCVID